MKMKKVWALLVSLMLVASMALPVALAVSDDQGASAAAVSSEEGTPPAEERVEQKEADPKPDVEPKQDDQESDSQEQDGKESGENQCTCGAAEGEAHAADCPLYEKPEADKADENAALYQKFLAAKTMEEANALYNGLSKEEVTAFRTWLEENNKLTALEQHLSAITPEGEPVTMPIVSFTKVGPLLNAPARRARMMRAAADQDDTGIVLNKSAKIQDGGSYQITLEAYATGATTVTASANPADIVLVLDVSGSMDDPMTQYNAVYSLDKRKTYYIQQGGSYRSVTWNESEDSWGYYTGIISQKWNKVNPKSSSTDTTRNHEQFYEPGVRKIVALQSAVNNFIDSVAEKSPTSQIALVKFAGDKPKNPNQAGDDFYSEDGYTYNYTQIVQNLTAASDSQSLKNAVDALKPAGATRADYGMELAKNIINSKGVAGNGRKKTVIMFTDGKPTSRSDFNVNVANAAIKNSKDMKTADTTVYTIGVFEGADGMPGKDWNVTRPTTDVERTNKYMHLVSSNYKNAEGLDSPGEATYPDGGKSYFLSAGSADELSSIFQQISQEVGGSTSNLDEKATIKDIVTPYFNMPTDPKDVKVYTAKSKGSTKDWEEPEVFKDGKVTLDASNNTVSVSGFSYRDNWCGNQTAGGNTTFHNGKKLIIQFNVTAKAGFLGGNDVPTNEKTSGIYDKEGKKVKLFEQPTVNVPIKEVKVTAADKNVYLLGGVTTEQLKKDATVKCGNVELMLGESNYGLEAWQNAYVDIEAGLKDKDGNALTGDYTNLTDDTTYTVSAKVAPQTVGKATDEKGPAATEKSDTETGKINVFTPELTFKDGNAYYGEAVPNDFAANQAENTVWKHGDTTSTDKGVTMLGTEPTLDIAYALDENKVEKGKYTKEDAAVKATVKIGDTDVTQYTTMLHQDCNPACDWKTPEKTGDPAFLIHIKTCQLTISKEGGATDEPYVFNILKDGEKYSEVTIRGNGNETLYELPVGTYTIQEDTDWSWRFTPTYSAKEVKLSPTQNKGSITCTNKQKKDKWINGFSDVKNNIFKKVATN